MKLLVIGCGSIGRRHAVNAATLAETAVADADEDRAAAVAAEAGTKNFGADLESALSWGPDGAIVAVPHSQHAYIANRAIQHEADVLVEKPIAADPASAKVLLEEAKTLGRRIFGVCNMRFHPAVSTLRDYLVYIGKPLFSRAHFGNYLPEMRPGEDYRNLYAADADQGGVILDGVHELDYLSWLFGPIQILISDASRLSELQIAAEDYAGMVLQHQSGIRSEVHLDYLRRTKRRGCEIVGTDGILDWTSEGKAPEHCRVTLYTPNSGWELLLEIESVDTVEPFEKMMREFVNALNGSESDLQTGSEALAVLEAAYRARERPIYE